MNKVDWEEPPEAEHGRPQGRATALWVNLLKPLVRRKGKWARIHEAPTAEAAHDIARNIRDGRVLLPPGTWEARARTKIESGEPHYFVYARYMGK